MPHPHQKYVEPRGDNGHTIPKRVALTVVMLYAERAGDRAHIAVATRVLINIRFGRHALDVMY